MSRKDESHMKRKYMILMNMDEHVSQNRAHSALIQISK